MNCHADADATDYLENWSTPSKIVPFIPASKASMSIAGVTITRHIARRLRLAASSPDLEKRIKARNGWSDWIFNSVDWDCWDSLIHELDNGCRTYWITEESYVLEFLVDTENQENRDPRTFIE